LGLIIILHSILYKVIGSFPKRSLPELPAPLSTVRGYLQRGGPVSDFIAGREIIEDQNVDQAAENEDVEKHGCM
jgi:hypothetical protein